jgi:hypothetical protein
MTSTTTRCAECGQERTKPLAPRLPRGWKRRGEAVFCGNCWRKHYVLRAVSMRVAAPLDCDWKELDGVLKTMWVETTAASNWMMTELYARDVRRDGEVKMPRMAHIYLYPEARRRFPELPSQTVAALEQAILSKYRARRYEVIWTCSASLPNHRYPTPFPVHNQSWSVASEGEARVVSVRIADRRMRLRLKQGPEYHRQMRAVDQMISGVAVRGELALYRQDTSIMCKMVAWLPRTDPAEGARGKLIVRTAAGHLLQALNAKDEKLWVYNGDHLRRWIEEHRWQLQRWAEDSKAENRPVPSFAERRRLSAEKFRRRLNSACHEISAQIAGYAHRRRFAEVSYDDRETGFVGLAFPYFQLRQQLQEKVEALGIKFVRIEPASGEVAAKKAPEAE